MLRLRKASGYCKVLFHHFLAFWGDSGAFQTKIEIKHDDTYLSRLKCRKNKSKTCTFVYSYFLCLKSGLKSAFLYKMYTQVSIPVGWNISLSLLFSGKQKNTFLPIAYLILKSRKMEVGLGSSLQGTNTFHLLHAKGNKNSPYLNGLSKLYLSFVSWKKITMALSLRNV